MEKDNNNLSGLDPKKLHDFMASHGHMKALGMRYHDHGTDWVELSLPCDAKLTGDVDAGIIASGPVISLMDNACGLACWLLMGEMKAQVTLDLRVDYMRPAKMGETIYGRAECYHQSRNISFVRGVAHTGDVQKPVAHVSGTFIRLPDFSGGRSGGERGAA